MPTYAVAGLTIASDMALPELLKAEEPGNAWTFELVSVPSAGSFATYLHEARSPDGRTWLAIRRDGDRYLLGFPGLADFVVMPSERRVTCLPHEGVADSSIRHLLLDQVIPRMLALDGSLVLHASAIACPQGAVAFLGPSGSGKSSLAASFSSQGFPLLSDDFLHLSAQATAFLTTPSYPGLRLWPDTVDVFAEQGASLAAVAGRSVKQRLVTGKPFAAGQPRPLIAIIVLSNAVPDDGVAFKITRMPRREGFVAVFEQAFWMERFERERNLAEFDRFTRLVNSTAVMRLEHRRHYGLLPAIRAGILRALDDLAGVPDSAAR